MLDTKKKLNKKGISGVDIAVAIVVISIGLSIIVSLFIVINKTNNKVNREIEATLLAKSITERIKLMPYEEFNSMVREVSNENYSSSLGVNIPESFIVTIDVDKRTPSNIKEAILFNVRKEGEVKIRYMLSNEVTEVKLPYVKYFDRAKPINEPNLNSPIIDSPHIYADTEPFEPIDEITYKPIVAADELERWYSYRTGRFPNNKKLARRKDVNNHYDFFFWEPRHIVSGLDVTFLLGKTMYSLQSYVKEVEFPSGVFSNVIITGVEEKIGIPSSGDEDGKWVFEE